MKSTRLFPALALLVGLALPAADPAVEAALRRPVDAARYPQAGAVVLLDETVVTLGPQGRSTIEGHQLIRILQDRALRQISDWPFLPVVHRADPAMLIGIISVQDVINAYRNAGVEEPEDELQSS